jgi:predicted nucleic acid-binding protein
MRFADTNVLLYAVSTDPAEVGKALIANEILEDRELCLSAQVLQEFYVQATRASREDSLSHDHAAALVETFLRYRIEPITASIVAAALATGARYGISYWDAAIVEAARSGGCDLVLSEDLQDGRVFDGVRVENPFAR